MKSSLLNHTVVEFQSAEHLELRLRQILDTSDEFYENAAKLGMLRYTIAKIWNKKESHKLCFTFEYADEDAFKNCQVFIEDWHKTQNVSSMPRKVYANRGVIIADYVSDD